MKHPDYQNKVNKAVDRQTLVQLMDVLNFGRQNSNDCFISMSGPFLEDLKLVDHYLPSMKMVSCESNLETFKRQRFHLFSNQIVLENKRIEDYFASDYVQPRNHGRSVVWLDYERIDARLASVMSTVLTSIPIRSLLKVTIPCIPPLNAELKSYLSEGSYKQLVEERVSEFMQKNNGYVPNGISDDQLTNPESHGCLLMTMLTRMAVSACRNLSSDIHVIPISGIVYSDSGRMLSVTFYKSRSISAIRKHEKSAKEVSDLRLIRSLRYCRIHARIPIELRMPVLSAKERFHLESELPSANGHDLRLKLGYKVENTERKSEEALDLYSQHCRSYPWFVRQLH